MKWSLDRDLTYEEAREARDAIGQLLKNDTWDFVEKFLAERADIREKELLQMCPGSVEQMVAFARVKGGVDELRLIPVMIRQLYSDLDDFVKEAQEGEYDAAGE